MRAHFINVGQGNMVLLQLPCGKNIMYDCNVTDENEDYVYSYLDEQLNSDDIDIFINSHRDADHMRGISGLNSRYGISKIWDSCVPGTTTDCSEYRSYMNLKRAKGIEKEPFTYNTYGDVIIRTMNGKNTNFDNANDQSLVVKVEYEGNSILLSGDTSYKSWKEYILPNYSDSKIASTILLASHHGSISFFDDPLDDENYYVAHIKKINPLITIISVGDNDTHPDDKAVKLYKKYTKGYGEKKWKVLTTNSNGTVLFEFDKKGKSTCTRNYNIKAGLKY